MTMTDQGPGNGEPAAPLPLAAPKPQRHPFATFLMMTIGIIALLPGVCAITFIVAMMLPGGFFEPGIVLLWLVCLAISAGGVMLIRTARPSRR
jgi:hypothetical protein